MCPSKDWVVHLSGLIFKRWIKAKYLPYRIRLIPGSVPEKLSQADSENLWGRSTDLSEMSGNHEDHQLHRGSGGRQTILKHLQRVVIKSPWHTKLLSVSSIHAKASSYQFNSIGAAFSTTQTHGEYTMSMIISWSWKRSMESDLNPPPCSRKWLNQDVPFTESCEEWLPAFLITRISKEDYIDFPEFSMNFESV